ncbi:MAG: site-2 protease family protein [Candidatus Eisenbacteria bacterium]
MSFGVVEALPPLFVLFFSIVVHEFAHGYVANRLGDPTAEKAGRLTLNPLAHVDIVGSVLVPLALIATGSRFLFGWAKPVPINPTHFRDPMVGMAKTGAAGPASNLILAFVAAILYRLGLGGFGSIASNLLRYAIEINVLLALFNLMPIPPLDGSRVILPFVPRSVAKVYWDLEPYGMFIVIGLLVTGGLWLIITPFLAIFRSIFFGIAGL